MTEQDYMRVSALSFLRVAANALSQATTMGSALPDDLRDKLTELNRETNDLVTRVWDTFGVEE